VIDVAGYIILFHRATYANQRKAKNNKRKGIPIHESEVSAFKVQN
jgi:hypothetical protein